MDFETAQSVCRNITAGWNLGNALDSFGRIKGEYSVEKYETLWHSPTITKELIAAVSAAGFNAVRLPVTWNDHFDVNGEIRKDWLDRVEQVAKMILDEGMYCILNVHHDSGAAGWLFADEENFRQSAPKFEKIWKTVAERFNNYGEKLLFEGFNEMLDINRSWTEPLSDEAYKVANRYNQLFVDTVRASGGNNEMRNLVVQTYSGGESRRTLDSFELPQDTQENRLIAEVHNYDPQGFCWLKAKDQVMRSEWGSGEDKAQLDDLVKRLSEFSVRLGVPVIIGEYGTEDKGNEPFRAAHARYLTENCAKAGIKCFWWDTSGAFSLFDRKTAAVKFNDIVNAVCFK
ncbi:MAG: glycoside hydrolase family 5 protein [Oscillospiraceae bacterium]